MKKSEFDYDGVLPVLKPEHFTSHDVVAKVRNILGMKRIGHTGTLDPLVTGVLPLCLGKSTRLVEYIQDLPKTYEAQLTLGYATDTEDRSGNRIATVDPQTVVVLEDSVNRIFSSFIGPSEQKPPMYSAIKLNGKKLYQLARQGIEVERQPRPIHIYSIDGLSQSMDDEGYPTIRFRVECSKGTYIRTLCVDLGKQFGYPAVMSDLRRVASGGFSIDQCLDFSSIEHFHTCGKLQDHIINPGQAIAHFPKMILDDHEVRLALTGRPVPIRKLQQPITDQTRYRVFSQNADFLGIFVWDERTSSLVAEKVWI